MTNHDGPQTQQTPPHEDKCPSRTTGSELDCECRPPLKLTGTDGNVFAVLGAANKAARRAGWSDERWKAVRTEATSGDYDHVLGTLMKHFDVY